MPKKSKKILVVDDNPDLQKATERLLINNGYSVISCLLGKECMEIAKREKPDAILMDVILMDGNGKEFAKELKQNEKTSGIPIIFATNTVDLHNDKGDESFEIDGQIYRAFAKPLHRRKILSVLRKEIGRSKYGGGLPREVVKKAEIKDEKGDGGKLND